MPSRIPNVNPSAFPDEQFTLWSIPSYDVGKPEQVLGRDVGSSKKTVQDGDVLLSKIVPHIRRAWKVSVSNGHRQIASSEWITFRHNAFLSDYIRHFLLTDQFHVQFMGTVAGVGGSLLRAQPKSVAKIGIPLPPLDEQRRIVGLLDRAAEIRRRADAARAKARAIIPALFLDMFGDPATNPRGWPKVKFGSLLDRIDGGWSPVCRDGEPTADQWGVLKLSAVKSSGFVGEEAKRLPETIEPRGDLEVHDGDLLFTRKNTIDLVGTAAVANVSARKRMLPDTIFRLVPNNPPCFVPLYVSNLINLRSFRPAIRKLASGSASSMPGISKGRLSALEIPIPPLSLQTAFAEQAERLEATARALDAAAAKAEAMAAGLSAEVFGSA
ncbi:type I restriction-modification system, S subunit [Acidiphilium sp. JA12-A1]|nr:type I restriction-modification system, S subunit [Acidiphilium sp. JA12-A1]